VAIGCAGALALAVSGLAIGARLADRPRPIGVPSADAEALVDRVEHAVGAEAWARTGAVGWTFSVTGTRHLWDREREWARVRWDDREAQIDLGAPTRGVAFVGERRLEGDEARETIRAGWDRWVNDAFWLAAPFKLRDPGTTRAVVELEGRSMLLVSYASGGATPGDAYGWTIAEDGTPSAWRMWVSVLPIGGLEARWEGWETLPTGARIATRRALGPLAIEMRDLRGAETLALLEPGPDPFALLAALPPAAVPPGAH
jgi:hypothetical protein